MYNGKERDSDLELNWDHYGFRMYDASIGRFTGVDPISDQFPHVSTFNYAENGPISNIDLWGLQAVFFQIAGRIGASGSVIPGPTASVSIGLAIDTKGNALIYHTESLGAGFGAFAGIGAEIGINFGAEDVNGLLGYGLNFGAVAGLSPLGGPQIGVEGNASIATEKEEGELLGSPTGDGDNGGGVTAAIPQLGGAIGFFAYGDVSYTSEIETFSIGDLENAGQKFISIITDQFGELSSEQQTAILNQLSELINHLPENSNNDSNNCDEECK